MRRPAPGTVLGVIAIVIALCGSAYAFKLGKNSVKSKQIAPNAVKGVDAKESSFGQVPKAANAGKVDGHDAVCPAGTFLHAGACFDTAGRGNSDWTGAILTCADAGGYMPSPSQLASIRAESGVDLGGAGNGSWADARYQDNNVNEAMTVLDNGTLEGVALAGPRGYRCAFALVR